MEELDLPMDELDLPMEELDLPMEELDLPMEELNLPSDGLASFRDPPLWRDDDSRVSTDVSIDVSIDASIDADKVGLFVCDRFTLLVVLVKANSPEEVAARSDGRAGKNGNGARVDRYGRGGSVCL